MEPLEQMHTTEKAILLHRLFPSEIPDYIRFTLSLAAKIRRTAGQLNRYWDHPFLTSPEWVRLASETAYCIGAGEATLLRDARYFGETLFAGQLGVFNSDGLTKYARYSTSPAFKAAAQILFGYLPGDPFFTKEVYRLCLQQPPAFLFDAINEGLRQQGLDGLNEEASGSLSVGALASLATPMIIHTDVLDGRGHWIDGEGNYRLPFNE